MVERQIKSVVDRSRISSARNTVRRIAWRIDWSRGSSSRGPLWARCRPGSLGQPGPGGGGADARGRVDVCDPRLTALAPQALEEKVAPPCFQGELPTIQRLGRDPFRTQRKAAHTRRPPRAAGFLLIIGDAVGGVYRDAGYSFGMRAVGDRVMVPRGFSGHRAVGRGSFAGADSRPAVGLTLLLARGI